MKTLIKLLLTTFAVLIIAYLFPNNWVRVDSFGAALLVALVLGLLNIFIKPILIILTLPITIVTLGLFLLVINALIVMLASYVIPEFYVNGFWIALLFSVVLSVLQSILYSFLDEK